MLGKNPATTFVVFGEDDADDRGPELDPSRPCALPVRPLRARKGPGHGHRERGAGAFHVVVAALGDYFDGLYRGDTQVLRGVFHLAALYTKGPMARCCRGASMNISSSSTDDP
jgi:hypothetical protein